MTGRQRNHVQRLERRRAHLRDRVAASAGTGETLSYDRSEAGALGWALKIVRAADHEGILTDLEALPVPPDG